MIWWWWWFSHLFIYLLSHVSRRLIVYSRPRPQRNEPVAGGICRRRFLSFLVASSSRDGSGVTSSSGRRQCRCRWSRANRHRECAAKSFCCIVQHERQLIFVFQGRNHGWKVREQGMKPQEGVPFPSQLSVLGSLKCGVRGRIARSSYSNVPIPIISRKSTVTFRNSMLTNTETNRQINRGQSRTPMVGIFNIQCSDTTVLQKTELQKLY